MKKTIIILFLIAVGLLGIIAINSIKKDGEPLINLGGGLVAYTSTTTTAAQVADPTTLKTGSGIFGGYCITNAGTASMDFYNATTTDIVNGNSARAATSTILLGHAPASLAAGCYEYNTAFNYGLLIDFGSGTKASTTIFWD